MANKSGKSSVIMLVIAFILVLGIGVFIGYKFNKDKLEKTKTKTKNTTEIVNENNKKASENSDSVNKEKNEKLTENSAKEMVLKEDKEYIDKRISEGCKLVVSSYNNSILKEFYGIEEETYSFLLEDDHIVSNAYFVGVETKNVYKGGNQGGLPMYTIKDGKNIQEYNYKSNNNDVSNNTSNNVSNNTSNNASKLTENAAKEMVLKEDKEYINKKISEGCTLIVADYNNSILKEHYGIEEETYSFLLQDDIVSNAYFVGVETKNVYKGGNQGGMSIYTIKGGKNLKEYPYKSN